MRTSIMILAAVMLAAGCSRQEKKAEKKTEQSEQIRTITLRQHSMEGSARLPGVLQPFRLVQLFAKVNGFVKVVNVDRGDAVRQGQVLAVLDAPEVVQQAAASYLRYTQAQSVFLTSKDRYKRLLETSRTPGTVSEFDLEAARSRMMADSAVAQGEMANYRAQESMKEYLTIRAPFDGIITERNVHPGALAGPSQAAKPMLVLQQVSVLRLVTEVPEQYASQVRTGDAVHFSINALPGEEFHGSISRSSQSLGSSYRSEAVEIDVRNTDGRLKPGMYAEVQLVPHGNVSAFVVPNTAIVVTTERKYVIAVENGVARQVDVAEGNHGSDSTEVFGSLRQGELVIANGDYRITDGQHIRI